MFPATVVHGVTINVYVVLALLIILSAGFVVWRVHRRRTALQREFAKALSGMPGLLGSIHPKDERIP
jgi:Flp pilus assembly protein TadB